MIYLSVALVASYIMFAYVIFRLTEIVASERRQAQEERATLLQRIQAPEVAIAAKAQQDMDDFEPPKLHLAFDSDEEWAEFEGMTND